MTSFDPTRPWEWSLGASPDDDELQEMLEAGKVVQAVIPDLGEVEIRLNGTTGNLDVWLDAGPEPQQDLAILLKDGGQAAVYALSGLGRDVRVQIRGPGALRRSLQVRWRFGKGVFTLFESGASRDYSV